MVILLSSLREAAIPRQIFEESIVFKRISIKAYARDIGCHYNAYNSKIEVGLWPSSSEDESSSEFVIKYICKFRAVKAIKAKAYLAI